MVDSHDVGAPGNAVHVRTAAGRTVGTAFTNSAGVCVVTVPARSANVVDTTEAGPGGLALNTGSGPLSVTACLFADS